MLKVNLQAGRGFLSGGKMVAYELAHSISSHAQEVYYSSLPKIAYKFGVLVSCYILIPIIFYCTVIHKDHTIESSQLRLEHSINILQERISTLQSKNQANIDKENAEFDAVKSQVRIVGTTVRVVQSRVEDLNLMAISLMTKVAKPQVKTGRK